AQNGDRAVLVSAEAPYAEEDRIYQRINYGLPVSGDASVRLSLFQYRGADSVCLYDVVFKNLSLEQGFHSLNLSLKEADSPVFVNRSFMELLRQFKRMPPGDYKAYTTFLFKADSSILEKHALITVDSVLAVNTKLRNRINRALAKTDPSKLKDVISKNRTVKNPPLTEQQLHTAQRKLNRSFRKTHGVRSRPEM